VSDILVFLRFSEFQFSMITVPKLFRVNLVVVLKIINIAVVVSFRL